MGEGNSLESRLTCVMGEHEFVLRLCVNRSGEEF